MVEVQNNAAECLVEERDATLILSSGSQTPVRSKSLFLNPTSGDSTNAFPYSNYILSTKLRKPILQSNFSWWPDPQLHWDIWVNKLEPKYAHQWQQIGIFDAIMSSKYKIMQESNVILGACRFWCDKTNTFVFPWGEATITLEDVMILGGFSVLGEPIKNKGKLDGEPGHVESMLIKELSKIKRGKRGPRPSNWINPYMDLFNNGDHEMEHAVFLTLWLSQFVLMSSERNIRNDVLQIAAQLAKGIKVALAPAVLASIYNGLKVLKNHISSETSGTTPLVICAPMNILQLWVWERFSHLSPGVKIATSFSIPRIARWAPKLNKSAMSSVMQTLQSPNEFTWRPYIKDSKNWCNHLFYMSKGEWFWSGETRDDGLISFAQCLIASELVGLDCIEQYQPHRVARQFGLSQDIPCFVPRENFRWEDAWETYDISLKNVKYYIPSCISTSCVTFEYFQWWRRWEEIGDGMKWKADKSQCNKTKKRKMRSLDDLYNDPVACYDPSHLEESKAKTEKDSNEKDSEAIVQKDSEATVEKDSNEKESEANNEKDSEANNEKQPVVENVFREEEEENEQEKIIRLKAEIAEIVAKIEKLESEAEANPNSTAVFFSSQVNGI